MATSDDGDFGIIYDTKVWQGHRDDFDDQAELEGYVSFIVENYRPDFVGESIIDAERFARARFNESWYITELISFDPATLEQFSYEEDEDDWDEPMRGRSW